MGGFIRKREVIKQTGTVIRYYGLYVYWRALTAPKGSTFLGLLSELGRI